MLFTALNVLFFSFTAISKVVSLRAELLPRNCNNIVPSKFEIAPAVLSVLQVKLKMWF